MHLQLHFQLILAGIFLWTFLLAGSVPGGRAREPEACRGAHKHHIASPQSGERARESKTS